MAFIIAATLLLLDQLSKAVISKNLSLNQSVPIIKGVFHLSLVHNRGAAFGVLRGQVSLFVVSAVVAIGVIFLYLCKPGYSRDRLTNVALSLILAGAAGNLLDRLIFGYVRDFLDFRIWPVFNLADSAVSVGTMLLGWRILRPK